jgi:hypothetical protein
MIFMTLRCIFSVHYARADDVITGFISPYLFSRNMSDTRLYDLLGVKPEATDAEIKKVRPFKEY